MAMVDIIPIDEEPELIPEENEPTPRAPRISLSDRIKNASSNLYHALGGSRASAALKQVAENNKMKAARSRVQASSKALDGEMYKAIDQYFKDHTSLKPDDVTAFMAGREYDEDFSPAHKQYFLTLAKKTLAINELIEKTFQEEVNKIQALRGRNDRQVQLEKEKDDERRRYANNMRRAAEQYQEAIQQVIDDANEHIVDQEYREALNKAREGKQLLKSEKYSAYDVCLKAFAKVAQGTAGTSGEFRRFHDAMMQSYYEQLDYITKRAEAGIKHETRRLIGQTDEIPENVIWRNLYRGKLLVGFHVPDAPGITYNLEIERRFVSVQNPKNDVMLVKQSKPIDGKQLKAFMVRTGSTLTTVGDEWVIMDPPGFFQGIDIDPMPDPGQGQQLPPDVITLSDGFYKIMIQKQKNGPAVNIRTLLPTNQNPTPRVIGNTGVNP
ncbi:hypothetical protein KBC03_01685 [Patescibacteria group bacterium]|nr:hypothetical protein [Patescibacteria group bacterium]